MDEPEEKEPEPREPEPAPAPGPNGGVGFAISDSSGGLAGPRVYRIPREERTYRILRDPNVTG